MHAGLVFRESSDITDRLGFWRLVQKLDMGKPRSGNGALFVAGGGYY